MSTEKRKHAIFFLRHTNDIDHITPVIYRWCQSTTELTHLILCTGLQPGQHELSLEEFRSDYRISFLCKYFPIAFHHISMFWPHGHPMEKSYDAAKLAAGRLVEQLCSHGNEVVFAFDHEYSEFHRGFYSVAKEQDYTCVGLPHGGYTHHNNHLLHVDALGKELSKKKWCHPENVSEIFDAIVLPDRFYAGQGQPRAAYKDRVLSLGSARFCKEWTQVLDSFAPRYCWPESEETLKVTMFLRSKFYPIFWEEVGKTIQILLNQSNLSLVIQHHPRENDFLTDLMHEYPDIHSASERLSIVGNEVPSASLTRWSDVIVDLATTMSFEGVYFNKPVLEMEYLHATYSTVAHYLPETHMHCRDDLIRAITKAQSNKGKDFYDPIRRDWFINNLIENNQDSVLNEYLYFLQSYRAKSSEEIKENKSEEVLTLLM